MTKQPSPSDFSRNEREEDYTARIKVSGTISVQLKASSAEDALRQAKAEVEQMEKDSCVEIDAVDELELDRVFKDRPMYRVVRDGKNMQVSHLDPGDTSRAPDENGF